MDKMFIPFGARCLQLAIWNGLSKDLKAKFLKLLAGNSVLAAT